MANPLAGLPAVHRLLAESTSGRRASATAQRPCGRRCARSWRRPDGAWRTGSRRPPPPALVAEARALLARREVAAYPEVLNATGVLIHTNLGRAPRLAADVSGYLALEYDLDAGARGERLAPVVGRLTRYFGAEAATVVTNNAAALVLLLAAHAAGREVIVSRGELIEIGGSFRLPEIMAAAGARLVEVGCTNRTRTEDYARAVGGDTAGILVVHRSNFHLEGFVATPELRDLVELAHARGVPLWVDEGSGCHLDLSRYGLRREPTVQEILATGADAVLFSGDKLLAGPQAGVLLGSRTDHRARCANTRCGGRCDPDKSALVVARRDSRRLPGGAARGGAALPPARASGVRAADPRAAPDPSPPRGRRPGRGGGHPCGARWRNHSGPDAPFVGHRAPGRRRRCRQAAAARRRRSSGASRRAG